MSNLLDPSGSSLSEVEVRKHLVTIDKLTEQSGVSKTEIGKLYEAELQRTLESTKIREFLPILIARRVKEDLRSKSEDAVSTVS